MGYCKKYWVNISLSIITVLFFVINYNKETINVNNGLGWDGQFYADATANFDQLIANKEIDKYRFQRILLPVVINKSFKILHIDFSLSHIIAAYKIFNFIALLIAIVYFFLICKKLLLPQKLVAIGFASLFWCFPILKVSFFYPTLSDTAAFSIGLMVAYYYLVDRKVAFVACVFAGAFVFPTFILFLSLIMFKKEKVVIDGPSVRKIILPSLFLICFLLGWIMIPNFLTRTTAGCNPINRVFIIPSVIIVLVYLFFLNKILPNFLSVKQILNKISIKHLIVAVSVVALLQVLKYLLASDKKTFGTFSYLMNIFQQSFTNPGSFLIAHTVYFGFLLVLIAIAYKSILSVILGKGYGAVFLFLVIGVFGIGSESRQLINFYPLVVVFVLMALKESNKINTVFTVFYLIASLSVSRFWQSINLGDKPTVKDFIKYPAQNYFKFQGPWMNNETYTLNLVVLVIASLSFFFLYKHKFFSKFI